MNNQGVSVVICCYNSAYRLGPTLTHLKAQKGCDDIPWEVIVVDNASTDGTAQAAIDFWNGFSGVQLKVIPEPKLGLSNARKRGFQEAQYEFVSFVDDDNWVAPNWVETVYEIMMVHPDVGACGGSIGAICEVEPPLWFEKFQSNYAVGLQATQSEDVTWTRGYLWGAGLTIRKNAFNNLLLNGFRPLLSDRRGTKLTAGEDSEICIALRLSGWKLWYESDLKLKHFMPAERLKWQYLRKLVRGFGASKVVLDVYRAIESGKIPDDWKGRVIKQIWIRKAIDLIRVLYQRRQESWCAVTSIMEGDQNVLEIETLWGQFNEIIRLRRAYDEMVSVIWQLRFDKEKRGYYALSQSD